MATSKAYAMLTKLSITLVEMGKMAIKIGEVGTVGTPIGVRIAAATTMPAMDGIARPVMMLVAWPITARTTKAPMTASGSAHRITKGTSNQRNTMTMGR